MQGGQTKAQNRLWQARKRQCLRQKQVALLLNHHTIDQVSRYEKGERVPTLDTALRLQIIYRVPIHILFAERYAQLTEEIERKMLTNVNHQTDAEASMPTGTTKNIGEFCTYDDRLDMPSVPDAELTAVRRHVTDLAKRIARL